MTICPKCHACTGGVLSVTSKRLVGTQMAIMARMCSERQALCTAHRRGWWEVLSRMLPHGLEPGTYLVAQFGNDQAVFEVIPAGQSGKLDGGTHGVEPLDR